MYIRKWCLSPLQIRHLGNSHSSPNCHQLPRIFFNLHPQSKISSLSKEILVLGKARSHRVPNLGCSGAESPGDLSFPKILCKRCDTGAGMLSWLSCQSPAAHSYSLLNHLKSFHRGTSKLNAKFDADSLLYSLSHFECDGHTVHIAHSQCLPPPLTSTVKSSLFMHVHSSPLSLPAKLHWCTTNDSCYINSG